jgi:asparagine synthase (glutamine-hydrolysing)
VTQGRRFAFASELKAFLQLESFEAAADERAIEARLAGNFADYVLLRGVDCVPPGHYLEVSHRGTLSRRWWNTLDHLVQVPRDFAAQADEFRELLFDACRLRARSDVSIATSLSGGLDSSSVLCSLAEVQNRGGGKRLPPEWRRAFIAGFPGTIQDETNHAILTAERAGAIPVIRRFSGEEFCAQIDDYLYAYEEIGGLAGLASWALYRDMRRDGVIVSLEGHGGDELLAGYDLHILLALMRGGGILAEPRRTLDLIDTMKQMYAPGQSEQPVNKLLLAALTIPRLRAVARRLRPSQRVLAETIRRHSFEPNTATEESCAEEQAIDALGPLTGALYRSFHRHSLPRILRNFDAYAMSHGIEARMPLLDWRVVCYGFSVPDESKAAQGYSKRLLREAMRGVLPEAVRLRRHKLGYNAPVGHWLEDGLGEWLWRELNHPEFIRSELWDGPALIALARQKRRSRARWHPAEARRIILTVTAHWWQTHWLRSGHLR